MAAKKRSVIGGVDTHRDTHHAAVIDSTGGLLADDEFPATSDGYADQMRGLVAAAPEALRSQLTKLSVAVLVNRCTALTVDPTRLDDPEQATAAALAGLARRVTMLTEEITALDRQLGPLVRQAAPRTSALFGVGTDVAAQLLTTAGDNPDRLRSEAALAHLCGAAPIPASSGRVRRHRLHRGGDRGANHALHTIALCRLRYDQRTRAYLHRRTTEGLSKREILRCLKRYIVRGRPTRRLRRPRPLTSIGASGWQARWQRCRSQ
ncbi:transposase [Micromonospora sp. SL4-19]|uniref:transposase n=1 Tax=Micromonospora sp. SL4-19 TaxID=3399129 RepID=UPI003A4D6AF0